MSAGASALNPALQAGSESSFSCLSSPRVSYSTVYTAPRTPTFVEAVLERFPLLPVDLAISRAQLWAGLMAEGRLIGPHDLWLASTCLAHGLTMVTANVREFARVPGLVVESWTSER